MPALPAPSFPSSSSEPLSAQPFSARRLFWLQLKAGPWWRFFVMLPLLLVMLSSSVIGSPVVAAVAPSMAAIVLMLVLYPEGDMARAYGLTREQAASVVAYAAVPAAAISFLAAVVVHPGGINFLGGSLAVIATVALAANSLPNDEPTRKTPGTGSGSAFAGSAAPQRVWFYPALWAVVLGAATGIVYPLSAHIPNEGIRQVVAVFPALFLWFAVLFRPELRPATAKTLGLTRKRWALTALAVAVGANALFGITAGAIALLFDAPLQPIPVLAAVGALATFAALVSTVNAEPLAFALLWMFFFPVRSSMDVAMPAGWQEELVGTAVLSAAAALISAVILVLYLTGRINASTKSASFRGADD